MVVRLKKEVDRHGISEKLKKSILAFYFIAFIIFGFLNDTPTNIIKGIYKIIITPDALITDYIGVGGMGAAFVNAGTLALIFLFIMNKLGISINGAAIASLFLMLGFALFGKNLFNVWLIVIGVFLYAKFQRESFGNYIYVASFGTALAPIITEIMFNPNTDFLFNIYVGTLVGLSLGFILPPLASHLLKVHQGYNLYNIGFTSGIIGTMYVSFFKAYGYVPESRLIWTRGNNLVLGLFLCFIFLSMILIGYVLNNRTFEGVKNIMNYNGILVSDFVVMEGFPASLINMGINGLIAIGYVLLVKGDLNGASIGGILTIVGFGGFGKHLRNMFPILLGVFLGSITNIWPVNDPSLILAALFGTSLAPIAGKFGWKYGVLAGFLHSSLVMNVGFLHGGLNLYNNGFSAGLIASILVPIIEVFNKERN